MFKRANKITALLVAAAAVVSIVPASAANASDRLGTKDGTIENAVAYKDGKYVYQGYRSNDDDDGIYYNTGDKDKFLDDVEDADLNGSYEDKYAFANDGDDQYLIDLTNGDVIDDDTPEDNADTAATKLKTQLKKTDRYGESLSGANGTGLTGEDLGYVDENNIGVLPGNKFGDTWYQYSVTPESGADGEFNTANGKLYGFTNRSGKYIDTSNVANIYAYSSEKGKVVKIEEFSNDIDDVDDDTGLLATLVKAPEVLTQDDDYIYVKTTVQIYDENATATDITRTTSASVVAGIDSSKVVTRTYIQKISKSQDGKKDDAYLPKTVQSYELTKGELDCGDADDAYDAITEADKFTVAGNQLLAIKNDGSNVKVTTINLKKDKVKYDVTAPTTLDSEKVDVYLAEEDDDDDVDIDDVKAVDIDVDGNVWAVADGKIYKFKDNEFAKVYTCDSSLDSLSVYDENNLITWEDDGDIYTTVNEGKKETEGEATPAQTGWVNTASGWTFYDTSGKQVVSSWVNAGGVWYMMKADGVMATGWYNDNGNWYYLNGSGSMQTGWLNDNGTWYYLKSSGVMTTGWQYVNGSWYYLNGSGAMQTGWQYVNGSWYYLNGSGAMKTGWLNDNGTWYYLNSNGSMAANTTVNGYRLAANGAWI